MLAIMLTLTKSAWGNTDPDLNRLGPYVGLGAAAGLSDFTKGRAGSAIVQGSPCWADIAGINI
jgi:hypothetical protein